MDDQRTLRLMKERFAGREEIVEELFKTSETFRDLCRDYLACSAILAWWERSDSDRARRRALEFSRLRAKLGESILKWMKGERGEPRSPFKERGQPWGN